MRFSLQDVADYIRNSRAPKALLAILNLRRPIISFEREAANRRDQRPIRSLSSLRFQNRLQRRHQSKEVLVMQRELISVYTKPKG